ncbi:CatB-related O-acetyltransferase [Teichococcus deserti]|uniref:CatB-related O-acetyltransferase n=1 Tax=Teichococcus deserti TaxID=1817963 RepID=UPI0009FAAD17|nr:CatB-related O-acetyltransferase [Pseudoroseomonas deserti]
MNITYSNINGRFWQFSKVNGPIVTEVLRFLPDGTLKGYNHKNERYWRIENGNLRLLNWQHEVTIIFDQFEIIDGKIQLNGIHLPNPAITLRLTERGTERGIRHETRIALRGEIAKFGWNVGEHTYGIPSFIEKHMARFSIGKYCSIASGVKVALGNHRIDTVTSYPFKALQKHWISLPPDLQDHDTKGDVIIGSDVWIGVDAFIGSGVTIGHGAVIGAKTVVVKDVPDYAVVVGNPGKVIKFRFDEATLQKLLALKWWNFPDDDVERLIPYLMTDNISAFLCMGEEIIRNRTSS